MNRLLTPSGEATRGVHHPAEGLDGRQGGAVGRHDKRTALGRVRNRGQSRAMGPPFHSYEESVLMNLISSSLFLHHNLTPHSLPSSLPRSLKLSRSSSALHACQNSSLMEASAALSSNKTCGTKLVDLNL